MNDATTTKAERNAAALDAFIRQGQARAAQLSARADEVLADKDGGAEAEARVGRLMAAWGRVTRRAMQAMVLDEKLDRRAAEDRGKAEVDAPRPRDPVARQAHDDILAAFRLEGLDRDDELELKELLAEMEEQGELAELPVPQNMRRIRKALYWETPEAPTPEVEAADPPPQGEGDHAVVEGVAAHEVSAPEPPQSLRDSSPCGGASEAPQGERPLGAPEGRNPGHPAGLQGSGDCKGSNHGQCTRQCVEASRY